MGTSTACLRLSKRNFFLVAAFAITTLFGALELRAQETRRGSSNVVTTQNVPRPSGERYQNWVQNFFETDELWRFKDKATFDQIVDSNVPNVSLRDQLKALYRDKISSDEVVRSIVHYKTDGAGGYVFVPANLRSQVPRALVESVHLYEFKNYQVKPSIYVERPTLDAAEAFLDLHFSAAAKKVLSENIIALDGNFLILVTPHAWNQFPDHLRREVVDSNITSTLSREGVSAKIVIRRGDDLTSIARKYAGERDYRPIERYFRMVLGSSESAEVPLEKIMHPFIRKMIDSYPECHGPNCFNSGLNVNRLHGYKIEHVADESGLMHEVYSRYRFVQPNEPLQAGDLLTYRNASGGVEHVSTYVGDGLVFTKNGFNKFNPYIFQEMSANEKIYFSDGKYQLSAFRIPKAGEFPVSSNGSFEGNQVFYRQHPELEYESIKFNPILSRTERSTRLNELSSDWVSSNKMVDLIRLSDDPRVADMRVEIQSVISQNLNLKKVRRPLKSIGFNPFGNVEDNRVALAKVLDRNHLDYNAMIALDWIADHHHSDYQTQLSEISQKFKVNRSTLNCLRSLLTKLI